MPIAKYKKDKRGLYYTYEKTGLYKPNGKPEYKRLMAKAQKKLDEKVSEYRGSVAFGVEPTKITFDEWEQTWFKTYKSGCRETTRNWYKCLYDNRVKPLIGALRMVTVREANVQAVLTEMIAAGYSKKYVKAVKGLMFSLFDTALANNLIVRNPALHIKGGGKEQKDRRALTPAERTAYLAACKTHPFGQFAAFLYFFRAETWRGACALFVRHNSRYRRRARHGVNF